MNAHCAHVLTMKSSFHLNSTVPDCSVLSSELAFREISSPVLGENPQIKPNDSAFRGSTRQIEVDENRANSRKFDR